jgi:Helix-turn-helix
VLIEIVSPAVLQILARFYRAWMSEASSTRLMLPAERILKGACSSDFWYILRMEPTEDQFNALGNYRDIITQNASKVAEALGISPQTLIGWTEGNGEPTNEQAGKILEFLRDKNKAG